MSEINHPPHYTYGGIEVIDFIEALKLDYREGNVVKYVCRHRRKGGVEDLKKARWYLGRLIDDYERDTELETACHAPTAGMTTTEYAAHIAALRSER